MKLGFNPSTLADTLPIMLNGMLGGIIVMALICGILMGMYALVKYKKKKA